MRVAVGGTGVRVAVGGTGVCVAVGGTGVRVAVGGSGVCVGVAREPMVKVYVRITVPDAVCNCTVPVPDRQPARYTYWPLLRVLNSLSAPFEQWFPVLLVYTSTFKGVVPGLA